jgi:hypothetical protein
MPKLYELYCKLAGDEILVGTNGRCYTSNNEELTPTEDLLQQRIPGVFKPTASADRDNNITVKEWMQQWHKCSYSITGPDNNQDALDMAQVLDNSTSSQQYNASAEVNLHLWTNDSVKVGTTSLKAAVATPLNVSHIKAMYLQGNLIMPSDITSNNHQPPNVGDKFIVVLPTGTKHKLADYCGRILNIISVNTLGCTVNCIFHPRNPVEPVETITLNWALQQHSEDKVLAQTAKAYVWYSPVLPGSKGCRELIERENQSKHASVPYALFKQDEEIYYICSSDGQVVDEARKPVNLNVSRIRLPGICINDKKCTVHQWKERWNECSYSTYDKPLNEQPDISTTTTQPQVNSLSTEYDHQQPLFINLFTFDHACNQPLPYTVQDVVQHKLLANKDWTQLLPLHS